MVLDKHRLVSGREDELLLYDGDVVITKNYTKKCL